MGALMRTCEDRKDSSASKDVNSSASKDVKDMKRPMEDIFETDTEVKRIKVTPVATEGKKEITSPANPAGNIQVSFIRPRNSCN